MYVRSTAMRPNNLNDDNNKWSKYFEKNAASPPHMSGSMLFTRRRQCACFRLAIFAHLTQQSVVGLGMSIPLKIVSLHGAMWTSI